MRSRSRNAGATIVLLTLSLGAFASVAGAQEPPPQTGFEQSNGASWTTHADELDFLAEVDERSDRVEISEIGRTLQGRPLHLVRVGDPVPSTIEQAQQQPTVLFVCTQHGNEPAGREACLKGLRDLAFTQDPTLVQQLRTTTFLFVPTANPDGRAANTRGNSQGVDVNRDHLQLATLEARAIAAVVRDWRPDLSVDLHEYGPGTPVLYDDDLLYLWPRNLNVERSVHDLAKDFAVNHIKPCATAAGYTSDEYGLDAVGDVDVQQTAGDGDEGIMRNAMGLRHSLGILIETAVSMSSNPNQLPNEAGSTPAQQRRRVASHRSVIDCSLSYLRTKGEDVRKATETAPLRKKGEGMAQNQPVYFGGADNQEPTTAQTVYPPPCAYRLTPSQVAQASKALELHGIETVERNGQVFVPVGQEAEPVIPLLLDARGRRRLLSATAMLGPPLSPDCRLPLPGEEEAEGSNAATAAGMAGLGLGLLGLALVRRRSTTV